MLERIKWETWPDWAGYCGAVTEGGAVLALLLLASTKYFGTSLMKTEEHVELEMQFAVDCMNNQQPWPGRLSWSILRRGRKSFEGTTGTYGIILLL